MGSISAMLQEMRSSCSHLNSTPRGTDAAWRGTLQGVGDESEDVAVSRGDETAVCVVDLAVGSPAQS